MTTLIKEVSLEPEVLPSVIRSIDEPEEVEGSISSRLGLKIGRWADRLATYKLNTGYWNLFRI